MTTRLLIDTSSLVFRAFFALPSSITDAEGHPVNAVRGYLDMVSTVVADLRPDVVRHCFDHTEVPEARLAAYPAYKAQRAAPPEGIGGQFALLRRLLPAMGEVIAEAEGWEADDAIGTLAAAAGPDDRVVVLTGDRDLIQLVRDPVVQVWSPRR
jgi:5'-3' exonuclease